MKQAIVENYNMIRCPHCGECRHSMMLIADKRSVHLAWNVEYAKVGEKIVCASCKGEFLR